MRIADITAIGYRKVGKCKNFLKFKNSNKPLLKLFSPDRAKKNV